MSIDLLSDSHYKLIMTRINLIDVIELSDQHLMAEYRELPRIINAVICGKLSAKNAPEKYCLGAGHVKFFANKIVFLSQRYRQIWDELRYRGFNLNPEFSPDKMSDKIKNSNCAFMDNYEFCASEVLLSRARIIEKIYAKPAFYKWTGRTPPYYLNIGI